MPVSPEQEQALPRFVKAIEASPDNQTQLNALNTIDDLKALVQRIEPFGLRPAEDEHSSVRGLSKSGCL